MDQTLHDAFSFRDNELFYRDCITVTAIPSGFRNIGKAFHQRYGYGDTQGVFHIIMLSTR